ncbi:tRNA pseudouridine(13) synthase TruD [Geomonas limicola]|uniref:tRNA pseudouridine(13) synthase TruD n=1 Tax=Geomonas limicola TaxID=2740186 RepID=UPI00161FFA84|nr:tRNA pseudouridine(13) synthase TruD [Geomonas limicola]
MRRFKSAARGGRVQRYLTAEVPGTGGSIKGSPEDFEVEEVPAYLPSGEGEHCFAWIEKRGITTLEMLRRLAKALGVPERDLGYAGMKDSVGITRQYVSIPRVSPDKVLALDIPGLRVVNAAKHGNKLRLGHLKGNRFRIRVRAVEPDALERAQQTLAILEKRGVPNRFGSQRYGVQGNSHVIGAAMLRGDYREATAILIGDPRQVSDERWREGIEAYRRGDLAQSLELFPGYCRTERDIISRLLQRPDDFTRAFHAVQPRLKRLYLSAFQSSLFDRVVEARLDRLDVVEPGDVAFKHANGACFKAEDAAAEAPRAGSFEISPTGPMFGCTMLQATGAQGELEQELLAAEGLSLTSFDLSGGLRMEGERRPLRVPLSGVEAVEEGGDLLISFALPRGSYATCVMSEIMKSEQRLDHSS